MANGEAGETPKATGFAALGELASDIGPAPAVTLQPIKKQSAPSKVEAPPPPAQNAGPYQGEQKTAGGTSGKGKFIVGAAVVLGAIWLLSEWNDVTRSPSSSTYTPAATPTYAPTAPPVESRPPVGTGLVLDRDQVRYCLAEGIRLDAAREVINNGTLNYVDRFNAMIDDYNSRCGNFRYRQGVLDSVRSEVEAERYRLQAEGASLLSR